MKNQVILSQNSGFCFGVKRAVEDAINTQKNLSKNIYTLGPLIHNESVIKYLTENNIFPIELEDLETLKEGDTIVIRSHGVPKDTYVKLSEKGFNIVDLTCPFVSNIQNKVSKYSELGYDILIVGDPNHPEVKGINGWCNNKAFIFKNGEVDVSLPKRVCVVSQTTEKQENWEKVIATVAKECKEFIAFNTICSATEVRQKNAFEISKSVDKMVIVGGRHSSNTNKLYEICKANCEDTIHIETVEDIPENFLQNHNPYSIGITAGASTPDWIIKEVLNKMNEEKNFEINEQLAYMEENDNSIFVGQLVKGKIISVNEKEVYVNIGYKSDAVLPKEEITLEEVELKNILNVGDEIEAKVISRTNIDGYVVLSRIEVQREKAFNELKKMNSNDEELEVKIVEEVKGGLIANYNGVKVFLPASHIELHHVEDLSQYIGKTLKVKVIEFSEEKRQTKIVISRRAILEKIKAEMELKAWETFQLGDDYEGVVKRLTGFGAFVEVEGVDGLLHVSEISWGKVNKPSDALKVGNKINVKIIELDKENKKLGLSIKALKEDPWKDVEQKYPTGNIVLGRVVRFADFGAFIELEPGVDGLVHISEISHKRVNKPSDMLKIGEQVKAKILESNTENKRISLSIKSIE
ncbi:bifunctional 4-hydroxy-3-methylbut-2-enyl diphosphate reductase/30S ribosomal protein S1 [Clostridium amazonitimonense]|uniref:bifunctional 4-hydroxy-3-methylbut-2-enyl diphosphate reductase/30S ribosomal protein S1 n=1 Tax=Clostridium amazonitimonense TaxID=1499689 RepID=UPI000509E9FC|nr:bifunctional 4-hydroxy-3-methylbut-2-enyl diphosphate reductase/30S ribosomal protein S1 [Clostridium amazonitimonense]